jgi:hypothetical protein
MTRSLVFPLILGCIALALVVFPTVLPWTLNAAGAQSAIVGP